MRWLVRCCGNACGSDNPCTGWHLRATFLEVPAISRPAALTDARSTSAGCVRYRSQHMKEYP